jgi:surface antigen/peptidoglycan hydrolase CwlO-like protein
MKLNTTTSASNLSFAARVTIVIAIVVTAVSVPMQYFAAHPASAVDYDAEIRALRSKVAGYESEAAALREKADTLQNALTIISNDKAKIQTEVDLYQKQHDQLVKEIKDTEDRIKENRRVSGDLIVRSSKSSDVSLIVRLASSDNLADYIDGEASRISVRDTIVQKTEENEKLKIQLQEKQKKVKKVLDEQKFKRDELASKEAEQARLVQETRNSEAGYQDMIKSSQGRIQEFQRMQDEIRRLRSQGAGGGSYITTGGSGGYPWANYRYPCWNDPACVDPWRLFYLECVSYVAWKLSNEGYGVRSFAGAGHAYQWPATTSGWYDANGQRLVTQSSSPKQGNALVFGAGVQGAAWTGHVMYVETVYGDGSIDISEYNWDGNGSFSKRHLQPHEYRGGTFLTFSRR